mgnify:CR=1 FL=1
MNTVSLSADFTGTNVQAAHGPAAVVPRLYGEALLELAREDPRIVCLVADLTPATETDLFRESLPERFFNLGIAEANMIGVAGGLARSGRRPWVHTFGVFATRRCYDQVAMQVAYPRLDVKIVGFLPGLTTLLGVSHQAIDDVALMRALPNMTILEAADADGVGQCVREADAIDGPVYLRMRRFDADEASSPLPIAGSTGDLTVIREGSGPVVFASGIMVRIALNAAELLAAQGISTRVIDVRRIKPLPIESIVDAARQASAVVVAENHSIVGGLGSAVAEALMEAGVSSPFERVGVRDTFAEGGSTPYLFERYGLSEEAVTTAVRAVARRASR